ncbi:hypothetical protein V6N13_045648 [Hibiscus sabdariffa]|uniref:Homeobox domain-containing protein n=1 Tax=Hibiscus sabdariffa TaxID=183260 RepID=A0ABR2RLT4_9ROSI
MGDRDDGLGLSLRLGCAHYQPYSKLSLLSLASHPMQNLQQKNTWNDMFQSSDGHLNTRSFLKGIDVNRAPTTAECEEEAMMKMAVLLAMPQGRSLGFQRSLVLEETFKEHSTLNPKQKLALAKQLNLRPRQVEVWFQNRRARTKLKQTEVDCEYLKRCCDNLTEENRRLHKEVQELRALKLSPQLYTHMNPPTTLTMCPSCERVAVSSLSTSAAATPTSSSPNHQRHVPVSPWAAMPISTRPFNGPESTS